MFTGLIEEMGTVAVVEPDGDARRVTISAATVTEDLEIDDSVAVDGCCLTVVERTATSFTAVAVEETLAKTTLGGFAPGRRVNLERALRVGDRLGGHYVLGHVDCVGEVVEASERESSWIYWIRYPEEHGRLVIPVGSIAINGVSLTAADVAADRCMVSIIPHTHAVTTFGTLAAGDAVNVEFDMVGKYVRNFVSQTV
jgi:riboflavin synthase